MTQEIQLEIQKICPFSFSATCESFHVHSKAYSIGSKKFILRHLSLVAVLSACHSFGGGDMMVRYQGFH